MANDTPSTETEATPAVAVVAESPAPATASAKPQAAFKVSIERWATKLSVSDKRVGLIHGFVHTMKVAKNFRDYPASYAAAFEAYAHTPFAHRQQPAAAATK